MKLIIQIPCFNEAETLHRVVSDLPHQLPGVRTIETLVVDDGSTDGTAAVALGLGVHHVVRHRRCRGLAAAFRSGMRQSLALGADLVVTTDGDHQYPGRYIRELVSPLIRERADLVIGNRRPETDRRNSLAKRWLYWLGRKVIEVMCGCSVPDPTSGFRAFTRTAAMRATVVTRYSYTIETLFGAIANGMAIGYVPIITNAPTRPSRLYRSRLGFVGRSGATILRVFFMHRPLQTLLWFSAAAAMVGLCPIVRFLTLYAVGDGQGHVQSLILGAALLSFSSILAAFGLLADLVRHNRQLTEQILLSLAETSHLKASPPLSSLHPGELVSS